MKKIILFFVFNVFIFNIFSQNEIFGNITDKDGKGLLGVNITVATKPENKILFFALSDKNGNYKIKISENRNNKELIFSYLGLKTQKHSLNDITNEFNVILTDSATELQGIVVKPKSIIVKGDTTEYQLLAFSDGTEKKVEDILKKLPGIIVSDEGNISFKGKSIEKITLDDTDLFDTDYKIASKNIPSNFLMSVQAIENYSDNSLLKNVELSNKVILNLKLKDELKLSRPTGDVQLGGGYKNMFDLGANLLSFSKKWKFYDTFSFDNQGTTTTFSPSDIIDENNLNTSFADNYTLNRNNIENTKTVKDKKLYNSFHFGYQKEKKLSITGQYVFDMRRENYFEQDKMNYFTDTILIENLSNIERKPILHFGKIKLKYNIKKNILLNFNSKYSNFRSNFNNNLQIPQQSFYNTNDKNYFSTNNADLTFLLKDSSAIVFNINMLYGKNSQLFDFYSLDTLYKKINQNAFTNSLYGNISVNYYRKIRKFFYFNIKSGAEIKSQKLELQNLNFDNENVDFLSVTYYVSGNFNFKSKIFTLRANALFGLNSRNIYSDLLEKHIENRFIFTPDVSLSFDLGKGNAFTLSSSYQKMDFLPLDYVNYFANYNSYVNSADKYVSASRYSLSGSYTLFSKLNTFLLVLYSFYVDKHNFTENYIISATKNTTEKIISPANSTHLGVLNFKTYCDPLRHGIQIDGSFFYKNYYNALNTNYLRNNKMLSADTKISLKSVFSFPLNYVIGSKIGYSHYNSDNTKVGNSSTFSLFQNLIAKPLKNWKLKLTFDEQFIGKERNFYCFINVETSYTLPKPDITFGISAYNLLNYNKITDYQITDYYEHENFYEIMAATCIFSIKFRI